MINNGRVRRSSGQKLERMNRLKWRLFRSYSQTSRQKQKELMIKMLRLTNKKKILKSIINYDNFSISMT